MGQQISPNPNPAENADGTLHYLFPEDGDYNSIVFQDIGHIKNEGVMLNNNDGGRLYNFESSTLINSGT
ncbi:hypothetical protein [Prochlorococcus sp. MIT 1303]|uniref:hypothetical protein n=1 Tax=Prochlorococcus sp. MIT 1303 TaxID=1723647 RepID=UPI0007B3BA16|nr:hypothetical protein [Prochlorococcus sp. MIT 1303]KZR65685.1 hypothetical protein PMIT1303_01134 [Prochlorococcus sp. MIT 1303]